MHINTVLKIRWQKKNKTSPKSIRKSGSLPPRRRMHSPTFFGRLYYRSSLWHNVSSVVCCGKTVRPSQKLSEGVNRKPGSKSWFLGSPPYFYFRFRRYSHLDGSFCLIFARTAQQSALDGTNGLSSSKPCAYCRIVWSELKPEVVLACRLSSVTFCIVAKWYVLANISLPYFYFRFPSTAT